MDGAWGPPKQRLPPRSMELRLRGWGHPCAVSCGGQAGVDERRHHSVQKGGASLIRWSARDPASRPDVLGTSAENPEASSGRAPSGWFIGPHQVPTPAAGPAGLPSRGPAVHVLGPCAPPRPWLHSGELAFLCLVPRPRPRKPLETPTGPKLRKAISFRRVTLDQRPTFGDLMAFPQSHADPSGHHNEGLASKSGLRGRAWVCSP